MALSQSARTRALGIYNGRINPQTGMEKHFAKVCRGEAIPLTAEEREWYHFVTAQAADAAKRDAERIVADVAHQAESAARQNATTISTQVEKIKHLESVLERQQTLIQSLLTQLEDAKRQLKQYEAQSVLLEKTEGRSICPVCTGDGGAKSECYKCGGSGWVGA